MAVSLHINLIHSTLTISKICKNESLQRVQI